MMRSLKEKIAILANNVNYLYTLDKLFLYTGSFAKRPTVQTLK